MSKSIALGFAAFLMAGIGLSVAFNDPYPVSDNGPKPTVTYVDHGVAFSDLPADPSAPAFIENLPVVEEPAVRI